MKIPSLTNMRIPSPTNVFTVVVLFLSTRAFSPLLGQDGTVADSDQGDPVTQIVWLAVYGITLLLIVMRWNRFVHVATRDKLLLLLVGIALFSVFWSAAPEVTVRRSVALLGTTLFGAYLATRYDMEEQLRLLSWALGIAALSSLVFALALPSYGIAGTGEFSYYEGLEGWNGIYEEKNALGAAMALGTIVFLLYALGRRGHSWVAWTCFYLSSGLLLLANAKAALLSCIAVLVLLPFYRSLRWQYTMVVPLTVLVVLAGALVGVFILGNVENVLSALGRDPTLTNRTEIWNGVIESIRQRPWLGYGYGGFWLGLSGESAHLWAQSNLAFGPQHAHNAFLDLWLNLGLLGVSVFAFGFLLTLVRALAWARLAKTMEGFWPLAYLTFLLLYTSTDDRIVEHNDILWILYVAVVLSTFVRVAPSRKPYFPISAKVGMRGKAKKAPHMMRQTWH